MEDIQNGVNSEDNKKPDNWKNQLSTAFNEEEMFLSLIVLAIFYVIYAIVKASFDAHDNSASDQERFNQSCFCNINQRSFYRTWFSVCCFIWLCVHSYSFLTYHIQRCRCQDPIKPFVSFYMKTFCCCICNNLCKGSSTINFDIENLDNQLKEVGSKIRSNYALLWFQYCKLYVVGYTGYHDKMKFLSQNQTQNEKNQNKHHICSLRCIVRSILLIVKYSSQLVTVSLLFLQIFDTYSFLCFSPDLYCSHTV